ncbi:MAG TPA: prephenate dehydrogenase/arogenate dehydrogenase family protein, partial [Cyclobacteriaceae bacterium]|nr:prephenate dehydrogenase/arogenate dehydrogenase family protein [Cyclobacteriaceae bacterium]
MKTTIVGLGLIGGSVALGLRRAGIATELIGVDANAANGVKAVELGLVDKILTEDKALSIADLIILSIPVNALNAFLPSVLDLVKKDAVVIDAG